MNIRLSIDIVAMYSRIYIYVCVYVCVYVCMYTSTIFLFTFYQKSTTITSNPEGNRTYARVRVCVCMSAYLCICVCI